MSYKTKHSAPSEERQNTPQGETLREKATKKLHGEGANPSQLGDPISLKAETSDNAPTDEDLGSNSHNQGHGSNEKRQGDTMREKAAKKLHGKGVNPSQLGDSISVKAETSDVVPTEGEEGAHKYRDSKL
ncbi:Fc.00g091840.m01.CDS01 [Cosmosporella sp. VM-42]